MGQFLRFVRVAGEQAQGLAQGPVVRLEERPNAGASTEVALLAIRPDPSITEHEPLSSPECYMVGEPRTGRPAGADRDR